MSTLAVMLVTASPLAAQHIDSPYRFVDTGQEAGVFAGYVWTDPGAVDLGPRDAMSFGARWGIRITGPFGVELSALVLPTTRMVHDTAIAGADTVETTLGEANLTLAAAMAHLRFDITGPRTWHRLLPFAQFGLGGVFRVSGDDALDNQLDSGLRYEQKTGLIGQLGLGLEWIPATRVALRFDAQDMFWKINAPPGFSVLDNAQDEWVQNWQLSAGLGVRF